MAFFKLNEMDYSGFDYGRPKFFVFLWFLLQDTLFRFSPIPMYGFRSRLLRLFGANIGKNVKIRPKTRVHYPWRVEIGDYCQIGDDAWLYSIGHIKIGNNTVISQKTFLCTAGHDHNDPYFRTLVKPITVGNGVWIASDVYVAPGVTIGDNSVIGARSSVFKDIPPGVICYGNPCKVIKRRETI
ncbi:MAG: WcaF family extracellular polysaccharide biosynthesis acetyltransferase [Thermodesulfobacteriota bacterium]